jgi:hypothetical protein
MEIGMGSKCYYIFRRPKNIRQFIMDYEILQARISVDPAEGQLHHSLRNS